MTVPPMAAMGGIVKRFPGGVVALDGVDFQVRAGEIHALLGENGAGKTTLMHILYGMCPPDQGEIRLDGRPAGHYGVRGALARGIGMVHQEFTLVEPFTVLENLVLGRRRLRLAQAREHLERLSETFRLGVRIQDRIEHLPVGVRQRVEILKLLFRGARLLILDEPTSVLTPPEVGGLFAILRRLADQGHGVVIVTHKLHEILALADRVTILRQGRVTAAGLEVSGADEPTLARLMVGREVMLKVSPEPMAPGPGVLDVRGLEVRDDLGRPAVRGVDLAVRAGEILAIAGVDGNGQSQLAEAVMGLRPAQGGSVRLDGTPLEGLGPARRRDLGMGYLPADRRGMGGIMEFSILRNSALGQLDTFTVRRFWLSRQRMRAHAEALMARFDVRAPSPGHPAGKLSGGNLQKLLLGRELMRSPRFLLLEQPTRGLDVGAIEGVWAEILAQRRAGAAILLISAELEEAFNLADRIAVMCDGRIMGTLERASADLDAVGRMLGGAAGPGERNPLAQPV